jgi:hypothetical protein
MNRVTLIERARLGHEAAGRGMVVKLLEDAEPRYIPREEAKTRLVEERADPGLLVAVLMATDKYDPKWQAVLFLELKECCTVSIIGYHKSEMVGSVSWTPVH